MLTLTDPMTDQLHSRNLVPFKKRRGPYHIPGMTGENERHALDVDHDLSRDEERYIRHYLGYADALLKNAPDEVTEPPEESASPQESSSFEQGPAQNASAPEIPEARQPNSEQDSCDKAA
ncbi:MAG TPA: hypothetical protein VGK22_06140 [Candidatus Angelobacter sp.]